mmetsp:Transcript_937/g.2144  ORF Transcript_937/g.2144 Transcript_937/m.2144 type:complete len:271 (-) Transcript_937:652-1464(-)
MTIGPHVSECSPCIVILLPDSCSGGALRVALVMAAMLTGACPRDRGWAATGVCKGAAMACWAVLAARRESQEWWLRTQLEDALPVDSLVVAITLSAEWCLGGPAGNCCRCAGGGDRETLPWRDLWKRLLRPPPPAGAVPPPLVGLLITGAGSWYAACTCCSREREAVKSPAEAEAELRLVTAAAGQPLLWLPCGDGCCCRRPAAAAARLLAARIGTVGKLGHAGELVAVARPAIDGLGFSLGPSTLLAAAELTSNRGAFWTTSQTFPISL